MKKLIMLMFVLSLTVVFAIPKPIKIEFSAKTGDKELDVSLSQFNIEANLSIKTFNSDMVGSYGVTVKKLDMLRVKSKMQPSDIYMALEVSKVLGKPINEVVSSYNKNKEKGWGNISKGLGIKPGSKEFKALKKRVRERKQIKEHKKEKKQIKKKQDKKPKKNNIKSSSKSKGKGKR